MHLSKLTQSGALTSRRIFTYIPADDFEGEAEFTYRLNETDADTPEIPVVIRVEKARPRIVINEIHYHPIGSQPQDEFIELINTGNLAANLSGWRFSKGISYTFPTDTTLDPGEYLVVTADRANFRTKYPTFSGHGNWIGQPSNGETFKLKMPRKNEDEVSTEMKVTGLVVAPVPPTVALSAGSGTLYTTAVSLELINYSASNKTGQNWKHSKLEVPPAMSIFRINQM